MKKITLLVFLLFSLFRFAQAQIQPPEFVCVKGDTLLWNLPTNTCGPFQSYDIFFSENPAGPYDLLASVTDPMVDFYFHVNPSVQQWFYYLQSNHDCPGQMALSSDTLDNFPPQVSPITGLEVQGTDVQITWQPSPSVQVEGHIVFRKTDAGVIPIDTVYSGNTYVDTGAEPHLGPESYFVNALDPCGTASIFDARHTTPFLEASVNPCEQALELTWTAYEGWANGPGEQEIWLAELGGTPSPVATAPGDATSFLLSGLTDGLTYCVTVQPVEAGTGNRSVSNEVCLQVDVVQPADELFLQNITVRPDEAVEVVWQWNTNAELSGAEILAAAQNSDYQPVGTFPLGPALEMENTFVDMAAPVGEAPVFYRVSATDDCGDALLSGYGATVFLTAVAGPGNVNQIEWTAFELENATVQSYEVYKVLGGTGSYLATVDAADTFYEDPFDPTDLASAQACYYVVASAMVVSPSGAVVPVQSRSNTGCVEQQVRIFVPNALAPEGINREFKPLIVLGDLASYELRVFDRYGQEVFFSNDPDDGWRGKKNGEKLPQGVYVYRISVQQNNGESAEKHGTVLLLR